MKNQAGRQVDRQEEYIQYLYDVIDVLKQKLRDAELQYKEYSGKLRHSEKICNEKEEFILFRESQLSELEDEIYKLKERIKSLTSKMSAPGSPSSPSGSRDRSRSRSRRRSIIENISLDTLSNDRLLEEINASADELHNYALGVRHAGNTHDITHLVERITRASEIIHNRSIISERGLASTRDTLQRQITELEAGVSLLEKSLEDAEAEIN